eukprot:UN24632
MSNSYIVDGGKDMFNTGNGLYSYSSGSQDEFDFEYSTSCTSTTEHENIVMNMDERFHLVLVNEMEKNEFHIRGDLGADGRGSCSTESTAFESGEWTGYWSQVCNSGDPSVNHIILTNAGTSSHSYSCDLRTEDEVVKNVLGSQLIY